VKKKAVGISIAIVVASLIIMISSNLSERNNEVIFHVTLANPNLYKDGLYEDNFTIKNGSYKFRFVPNGDSPPILSITLMGESLSFTEDFKLEGTPHETGISTYYTWGYIGPKDFSVKDEQELFIIIDPHDNLTGPVSVEIVPI
jgi:hypothetical protein